MSKLKAILDAIGVQVAAGDGLSIRFSAKFRTTLGIAAAAGLLLFMSLVHYTQTPGFCRSCHIMEPYYQAWHASKHNKVSCVKCHYPPASAGLKALLWRKFQSTSEVAKYVTRTYASKPYADVTDAACLQCHSDRLLEGWVKVGDKGVRFDHRPHLTEKRRDRQLRCTSCHSQVMVGGNTGGSHIQVTFDTCYTCHFKGMGTGKNLKPVGGCLSCHTLPARDFKLNGMTYNHKAYVGRGVSCMDCHLGVVSGDGAALKDRCFTCHNQPEKLARYTDIPFLHENHVTKHHVACFHCHQKIKHGFAAGEGDPTEDAVEAAATPASHPARRGLECSNCHQDKHNAQLQLYSAALPESLRAKAGPELASPMYSARVSCSGCHYSDKTSAGGFAGVTQVPAGNACEKCHGARLKGALGRSRLDSAGAMKDLGDKLEAAKAALSVSTRPAADLKLAGAAIDRALKIDFFLSAAHPEHNVFLASLLLRDADEALNSAGRALGAELADITAQPLLSGSYCATQCHLQAGVKVPPETVRTPKDAGVPEISGRSMPHKAHAEMMGCVKCHGIGGHRRVPLRADYRDTCRQCHN